MFLVVSYWEPISGHEQAMDEQAPFVLSALRRQPGVVFCEAFKCDGKHVVVHGYVDEDCYNAVQNDSKSEFEKEYRERLVEQRAHWLHSECGESFPHA